MSVEILKLEDPDVKKQVDELIENAVEKYDAELTKYDDTDVIKAMTYLNDNFNSIAPVIYNAIFKDNKNNLPPILLEENIENMNKLLQNYDTQIFMNIGAAKIAEQSKSKDKLKAIREKYENDIKTDEIWSKINLTNATDILNLIQKPIKVAKETKDTVKETAELFGVDTGELTDKKKKELISRTKTIGAVLSLNKDLSLTDRIKIAQPGFAKKLDTKNKEIVEEIKTDLTKKSQEIDDKISAKNIEYDAAKTTEEKQKIAKERNELNRNKTTITDNIKNVSKLDKEATTNIQIIDKDNIMKTINEGGSLITTGSSGVSLFKDVKGAIVKDVTKVDVTKKLAETGANIAQNVAKEGVGKAAKTVGVNWFTKAIFGGAVGSATPGLLLGLIGIFIIAVVMTVVFAIIYIVAGYFAYKKIMTRNPEWKGLSRKYLGIWGFNTGIFYLAKTWILG